MSQPSYPSEINPRASDEASNNRDVSYWLGPNEAAAALFELKKSDSKRCSNPVWNFYHRVKRAKTDVTDKQLPYKWLQNSNKKSFMSCNGCDWFLTEAEHPHPLVETLKNAGGGAMEQTFLGSVQRGARDRQVGVHPAFSIPSFLDPRSKNKVPDLGAVYERVRAILNEQETKKGNPRAMKLVALMQLLLQALLTRTSWTGEKRMTSLLSSKLITQWESRKQK
ncbi:hypothetical protein IV203_018317 [Nitzschia inconspicua]|uniref:Uncharacterized protein n=1 Tax=Nitzschia inconspicua TaxID=303405 RepID=A0A9K3M1R5_9STRA|nr:hypothetical protein IV203_018317 [Nitzschia inconspicua]